MCYGEKGVMMMKVKMMYGVGMLLLCISVTMGCSQNNPPPETSSQQSHQDESNDISDLNWRVPDFTATDHTGNKLSLQDLKGDIWLVDLIFTRCNNVCPPMTANMAKVQQELQKQKLPVKIVSFSVDPDYDQPEILTAFAKKYNAQLTNWHFLTGYSLKDIQQLTQTAFKGTITQRKGPSEEVPIMVDHPTRFYLIDKQGKVRKLYNGLQPDPALIAKDVQQLQQEK